MLTALSPVYSRKLVCSANCELGEVKHTGGCTLNSSEQSKMCFKHRRVPRKR